MNQTLPETAIIENLNKGDIKAFDELYFTYHKIVFANIFKLVKKQEEAEELLQDVFIALWQNKSSINSAQCLAGWLSVVSHNKAINHLNKSIKSVLVDNNIDPLEIANFPEITETTFDIQLGLLNEAIDKLPSSKKAAFTMCKLQGKTYNEAATILGISPNTVKEHIVLATKFIKAYTSTQYPISDWQALSIIVILLCSQVVTIA